MRTLRRIGLHAWVWLLAAGCAGADPGVSDAGGAPSAAEPASDGANERVVSGYPIDTAGFTDVGAGSGGGGAGGGGGGAGAGGADGQFRNAVVEVYKLATGRPVLLGSAVVGDRDGMVTIFAGAYNGPTLIKFRGQAGAQYFDEALGASAPFHPGEELNAIVPAIASTTNGSPVTRNYGVTAYTEAAYQYALANFGLAALADPEKIRQANETVRSAINAQLPAAVRIEDLARLPVLVGPNTASRSTPDTANGRYALSVGALNLAAREFNPQLARPGRSIASQLAADLTDGLLDERDRSGGPVAQPGQAAYSAATLAGAIERGVLNLSQTYAAPELHRAVNLNGAAASIRLTWGAQPTDLDAHLLGPRSTDHVWYGSQATLAAAPFVSLDVDDTDGDGPELVRLARVAKGRTYRYYVNNFSRGAPGIAGSPARVEVILRGVAQTFSFTPPPGENTNLWWSVFDLVVGTDCTVVLRPIQAWSATEPALPGAAAETALQYCD